MTIVSQQLSQSRTGVLGILLDAANPARCGGRPALWPLWADEAMHRAYSFVSLTVLLDVRVPPPFREAFATQLEVGNAIALARSYRALDIVRDLEVLPCADLLQSITHGLVALFGPTIGDIGVRTGADQILLQAFKRRALILACGELVVNALRHAFDGESKGRIDVTLAAIGSDRARLVVADDGRGMNVASPWCRAGIAADLALLLEGELEYHLLESGGTIAEIQFPARF